MNSKSAKNRLVVLADLPESNVPNIGAIPSHYLFPIVGKLKESPEFHVHSDGSIFQLFKMEKLSLPSISKALDEMPENSSIQIYKLHENGNANFYMSVRIGIDYSFINLEGKKIVSRLFSSCKCYWKEAEKRTTSAFKSALEMIPEGASVADWGENELIQFLCDYSSEGDFIHSAFPVKSNISAILSGQGKYSCVFSINNLDAIPMIGKILDQFGYVETVTIVKPTKVQSGAIENNLRMNRSILEAVRPPDLESRSTGVDTIKKDFSSMLNDIRTGIFFINVSFCLKSITSMADLKETYGLFEEATYQRGIVLYSHSNSARAAYISLFPGNGVYGEHWNTVYKRFGIMLVSKVMAL
jgi:hypothetical protein